MKASQLPLSLLNDRQKVSISLHLYIDNSLILKLLTPRSLLEPCFLFYGFRAYFGCNIAILKYSLTSFFLNK